MSAKKKPVKRKPGKPGPPGHAPTDQQRRTVEAMSGYGVTHTAIAAVIGVHYNTLAKHYATELEVGHGKAMAKVAQNLFTIACGQGRDAVTAAIFYLKCRAGWKPPADVEVNTNVHVTNGETAKLTLTPEQDAALKRMEAALKAKVKASKPTA